jgi:hypothetical protein
MLNVIKYFLIGSYGLPLFFALVLVSLGIAISIGEADYIGVNSFPGAVIATYFFLFTGIGKNNKKYIMKRDFPISFFKINLSKFISFYVMLILLSVIIFYFEMSRGAELMPTLIELLKIYIGYYFGASFLGKMFEITDTKTVVNIPNVLYILTAIILSAILFFERPDVLQMQGIPSNGIYGAMLYLSILLLMTIADFVSIQFNRNKFAVA